VSALPVIERELIAAARKPWTARMRILFALAGVVTCLMVMAVPRMPTREQGIMMLVALSILSLVFALFSGCFLTADCISREKREGTLGLLFLTPLRYRDVVLGKLVSSSVLVSYGLLAVFPVFFLPLLNGGVTWAEVLRVILALLVTLSLSLCIGLFCSVLSTEAKTAVLATFATVLVVTLVPLLYLFLEAMFTRGNPTFHGVVQFSPSVMLMLSFDEVYRRVPHFSYWGSAALQSILALGLFFASVNLLPRRWTASKQLRVRPQTSSRVRSSRPTHDRGRLSSAANPYAWAAGRGAAEPIWFRGFRGVMLLLIGSMAVVAVTTRHWEETYSTAFITAYALHLTTKFMMALEATRSLHGDRQSGALELLLVTPAGAQGVLPGAHLAYRRATRRPFRCMIWVNLGLLGAAFVFHKPLHINGEALTGFTTLFLGGIATAFADRSALAWVGFRQSLVAPTHLKAALMTLAQVMIPGWLLLAGVVVALTGVRSSGAAVFVFGCWFAGCLLYSFFMIAHGHTNLPNRFRELAAGGPA